MKNAEEILKFNLTLRPEELLNVCQFDLEVFRSVPSLLQKYYIAEETHGSFSGIYVFETKSARESFWTSELAKNIPARYGVILDTLRVEPIQASKR